MEKKDWKYERIYLSEFSGDLENHFYTEPKIFEREQELYYDNLVHVLMDMVGKEIARLTNLQREVLMRLFYKEESTYTIAEEFGIARQSVQKIQNRALDTLKRRLTINPYFQEIYREYQDNDPKIEILIKFSENLGL